MLAHGKVVMQWRGMIVVISNAGPKKKHLPYLKLILPLDALATHKQVHNILVLLTSMVKLLYAKKFR